MKRSCVLILMLALILTMAGCNAAGDDPVTPNEAGNDPSTSDAAEDDLDTFGPFNDTSEDDEQLPSGMDRPVNKVLIAYFSRTGENYSVGIISKGNTAVVAELIAEQTGGDLFEIEPVTPYPVSYEETYAIVQQESDDNARPPIADTVADMDDYDTVFIGYPIWRVDLPMIVYNFLESYDFSGKTVIPFATHGGSGQAGTQETIESMLPDSTVLGGIAILGSIAQESPDEAKEAIMDWLEGLGVPTVASDAVSPDQ